MNEWTTQVGMVVGIIGFVWSSTWFLSRQFANTLEKVYLKIEALQKAIVEKLEYHERHDDSRFESIRNSIWELRLQNTLNRQDNYVKDQKDNIESRT